MKQRQSGGSAGVRTRRSRLPVICTAAALLLGLADALGLLPIAPFRGAVALAAFTGAAVYLLRFVHIPGAEPALRFLRRALVIAAVLELGLFQWHSLHLVGGGYEEKTLLPGDATAAWNISSATGRSSSDCEVMLEYRDINMPVGTLTFDVVSDKRSAVDVTVDMSDDTNAEGYRYGIASAQVLRTSERSRSIVCNFSGNVHSIRFRYPAAEGETITLRSITVNRPIAVHISLVRLLVMLGIMGFAWVFACSGWAGRSVRENASSVRWAAYMFTAVLMIAALFLAELGRYSADPQASLAKDFRAEHGNQITEEIVDAFEDGHTYLNITPGEALLALENPYDWSARDGVSYPWDHLLYNGKIYSYYGIAPVIVLFLPYHLLTGYYFPTVWAVWLFGCIGILFLTKLYLCFVRKFFPELRTAPALLGLVLMQAVSGSWFCFFNPLFYEIAQISGFACVTAGAYFLLSANVIGEGKLSLWRIALSSVLLSLGVLSRPTLAVYCMAAMLLVYAGWKKLRALHPEKPARRRAVIPYLVCALVPYAVIGAGQMLYNYARFGSFFDFGIDYSLTINDFTQAQYHTHFVLIGVWNYLLAIPDFQPEFPFFDCTAVETFRPQGYYFVATDSAVGLFWKALPMWSFVKAGRAYRIAQHPEKRLFTAILLAVCAVCPAAIMFSIWESGYGARYCVDFAWQMLLGALAVVFLLYGRSKNRSLLDRVMTGSALFGLFLVVGQTYTWIINALSPELQSKAYAFAALFEVWR